MKLTLERLIKTENTTIGKLFIDGVFECFILEDCDRDLDSTDPTDCAARKIKGKTAIPRGTYEVVVTLSQRFNRRLPLLLNVPAYEGIRMHIGNFARDTEGCLLPGTAHGVDEVYHSRVAFEQLFPKIDAALAKGEKVHITVV